MQDYIYGVNRATGVTVFKHELPAGLYIDNLSFDWVNEELWAIAFDPNAPGGATATLASWSPVTGNLTSRTDVSAALRGGFVYGGAFSMCATTRQIYVGIDANQGGFNDRAAQFDVSGATPRLVGEIPLYFPVPSGFRAVCNASGLIALLANTIQADSEARETMLIGNVVETEQRAGLFIPIARGDLPAFNQNGQVRRASRARACPRASLRARRSPRAQLARAARCARRAPQPAPTARGALTRPHLSRAQVALFLNGMFAEFNGQVLIPVYPPYTRGSRGPPGGFLWTVSPFVPGPTPPGALTPLNYYLAGAAGVPTV